jgi:hypothetical protein
MTKPTEGAHNAAMHKICEERTRRLWQRTGFASSRPPLCTAQGMHTDQRGFCHSKFADMLSDEHLAISFLRPHGLGIDQHAAAYYSS